MCIHLGLCVCLYVCMCVYACVSAFAHMIECKLNECLSDCRNFLYVQVHQFPACTQVCMDLCVCVLRISFQMDYFTQLSTRICHIPFMLAGSLFVAWQHQFIEDSIRKSRDLHGSAALLLLGKCKQ